MTSEFELLATLTHEQAGQYVGQTFRVRVQEAEAELKLDAAERLMPNRPRSSRMKRDPFSLYFVGPNRPFLPQGMYDLAGDAVSFRGVFLVPLGPTEDGAMQYEAVFT